MAMRIRTPRKRPTGTPRPKRTIAQAMKGAAKTITKRRQDAKNVLTGMSGRPAPKSRPKRKPIGTPRPRTTTPKPPETRQLADMRRMSRDIDTRMKQLSIDRGRTKGAKSTIGDRSTSADEKMAALARERRARRQSPNPSMARVSAASRRVRGNTAKPNVTGIKRAMASMMGRRRKSRI